MKEIPLTQGLVTVVDDEDYGFLMQWRWYAAKSGQTYYAVRHMIGGTRRLVRMHRLIVDPSCDLEVDHFDGNGLNNQRSNLRIVTRRQNNQNVHRKTSSRYPGVCWNGYSGQWKAQIQVDGKNKHVGYFSTELEAFEAYQRALRDIGEILLDCAKLVV